MNLTREQKDQFNEILEEVGATLDISETEHKAAVQSYQAVGSYLSAEGSNLAPYEPTILLQGSFLLGTVIKPVNKDDDLDLDLICQLKNKPLLWTQKDMKNTVGDRLKEHKVYNELLKEEGRRCWTLKYRDSSNRGDKYHMDILPSIVASGYQVLLKEAFSQNYEEDMDHLAIRITDKMEGILDTSINVEEWMKSNPFGYARWFYHQASIKEKGFFNLRAAVEPVPGYQSKKLPLQRVVQILKRHRDMMFNGDENKPISIIITTLAAKAYGKETDVIEALMGVVSRMRDGIQEKYDPERFTWYKFVANPVNPEENFADKWLKTPEKEKNFFDWLDKVEEDLESFSMQRGIQLQESLSDTFGRDIVAKAFTSIGERKRLLTKQGRNRFDRTIGLTSAGSNIIPSHKFFGNAETED